MNTPHKTWKSPHSWLADKTYRWDSESLREVLIILSQYIDADEIQETFESEMDADGYFK